MKVRPQPESSQTEAAVFGKLRGVLDQRPMLVALAGPNGAGKTTFYYSHLKPAGLRFLNADGVAQDLEIEAYEAAEVITQLRRELVRQRESFVFETVFSDPVGDKLAFLKEAAESGYTVVLCFIGIAGPQTSEQRVAMRVSQGGHDVPTEKLVSRFPRTMANLATAVRELPYVLIFDNDDLRTPFRKVEAFEHGKLIWCGSPIPKWMGPLVFCVRLATPR